MHLGVTARRARRWRLVVPVILTAVIGGLVSAVALGATGSDHGRSATVDSRRSASAPPALDTVSTRGTALDAASLLTADERALRRMTKPGAREFGAVSVLATLPDSTYYRLANAAGVDCYAVGPAGPNKLRFAQIGCMPAFPSAQQPILDFTFGHAYVVAGIAADGVAKIVLKDAAGGTVDEAPVHENVYSLPPAQRPTVATLVAEDAAGNALYTEQMPGQLPHPG